VAAVTEADFGIDLESELEAAIAEHRAEVEAIAAGPWPPAFDDTIGALEASGDRLLRAERLLEDASSTRSTPEIRALDARMRPRLADHRDAVALEPRVVARIADLHARRERLGLGAEERCVLERRHRDAVRAGATLRAAEQERLRAVNARVAALQAEFRRRLLEETRALALPVSDEADLRGLPEPLLEAARRAAGDGDGFRLELALPSAQPALDHLHDRTVRERLWRASVARGRRGGPGDNRPIVAELAALRAGRAGLLGFGSHAEYAIAEQTAGSLAAVDRLLAEVGAVAADAARADGERHAAALRADGHAGPLQPWDWPYYAARERLERHALDETRLREHFVLDRVLRDGAFALAGRLYGLRFEPRPDAARPHRDVAVFDVHDEDGGERGRLYVDAFAREGKVGGGWMDAYTEPALFIGRRPLVVLVLNATRPADGAPALLTPLDVRILFHEFGHALHMLLSDVAYPRIAGVNVAHDVAELPSTVHEALGFSPAILAGYARHHATGAPLADADAAALGASERIDAAARSLRNILCSRLDQAWHRLAPGETVADVDAFEAAIAPRHGLDVPGLEFTYRSSYFDHIFDGAYDGTHYAYQWSSVLEAGVLEWLDEQGGPTRAAGQRLREALLARGAVVDPLDAVRAITGREPSVEPLLRRRGLAGRA
jgi:peptidyl-dipeptidase Dcp